MGDETGFGFLDAIADKFTMAYEDTIIITGNASTDVVNMCIASNITYLIEKPIRAYTLQLSIRAIVAKYIRFAKRLLADPGSCRERQGFLERRGNCQDETPGNPGFLRVGRINICSWAA